MASIYTGVGALVHAGWSATWHGTRGKGHAAELAAQAAMSGADVVVVVGGDGTVNEAANGLVGTGCALALLPAGTGNVLAAQLGLVSLPTPLHKPDPLAAATRLAAGGLRSVDLGHARARGAGGRYFVLWAGVGLDAEIVRRVEDEGQALKRSMGPMAYAAVGISSMLASSGARAQLRCDGQRARVSLLMAVVANVPLYAGAVLMAPHAQIDDGHLDLVTFAGKGAPDALRHLAGLTAGRPPAEAAPLSAPSRRVTVVAASPMPVHLDAEPFGHTPFSAAVVPGALLLLVPQGAPDELFSTSAPTTVP
jgi:diacylglycerol kinase (ATP)